MRAAGSVLAVLDETCCLLAGPAAERLEEVRDVVDEALRLLAEVAGRETREPEPGSLIARIDSLLARCGGA